MRAVKLACIIASLLVFVATLLSGSAHLAFSANQPTGKIKGVVLDANEARVVNAVVRVQSGKVRRKLKTSEEGGFEFEVPAGTYRIIVEANGFRRFTYSSLEVKPNETAVFDIHLVVAEPPGLVPASSRQGASSWLKVPG